MDIEIFYPSCYEDYQHNERVQLSGSFAMFSLDI